MFGQRPVSVWEADGGGQGAVALGSGTWPGCCPGSHCTWPDCRGCSSGPTPSPPAAPAATAALTNDRERWYRCKNKVLCLLLFVFKYIVLVMLRYNCFYSVRLKYSLAFLLFIVIQPTDMHRVNLLWWGHYSLSLRKVQTMQYTSCHNL